MKEYKIVPVAKPRMTQSDRWKKRDCVIKYWNFKDEVRVLKMIIDNGDNITFLMPMPKSWSKKKKEKMNGKPHMVRPDLDNLLKALLDAIFTEDSHIWELGNLKKVWAYKGSILISY